MDLLGKPRVRDVTTLVVESTDLRYLATRGGKVVEYGSEPLPAGLVVEGLVTDAVALGKLLDRTARAHGLDRKRVIMGVSGWRSIPRLLTMPKLQASLMEQTIAREAKREMPVSLENLYLSWQSMPGEAETQRIYVLGVPRELIDAQVRALQAAGIAPFAMDLKPLALVRAIRQPEAIIVSLEQDEMDIVLAIDYVPAIMRTFSLENEGLDLSGKLERLVSELNQTVRFYNDSHPDAAIKPSTSVFVAGKLLDDIQVFEQVKRALDRPVERPIAPLPCPPDCPALVYMTNLGLALKKVL